MDMPSEGVLTKADYLFQEMMDQIFDDTNDAADVLLDEPLDDCIELMISYFLS